MLCEDIEPKETLASIEEEPPPRLRRRVVEILREASEARGGMYCKYGSVDGSLHVMDLVVSAEGELEEFLGSLRSRTGLTDDLWEPRNPPKETIGSFHASRGSASPRGSNRMQEFREALADAAGVHHDACALLYHESRFVGLVALYRAAEKPFRRSDIAALNEWIDPVVEVFSRAERRERELLGERPAHLLFDPDRWNVEGTTGNAGAWLTERRQRGLVERLRSIRSEEALPLKSYLDGFRIWLNTIRGELGRRFLATVEQSAVPRLAPEAVLTPRQSEVAGYAAAGATNREIADTLGITPDTVSDHISESYRRLGVANRVELALKLEGHN